MMDVFEDETTCGPLCPHPACWQSTNRKLKNIPHKAYRPPSPEDIELDLPTLKVCNMLEDYGKDENDLYPSEYGGRPKHERNINTTVANSQDPTRKPSIKQTNAPVTSPVSPDTKTRRREELNKKLMKYVEVQEVFDLEDLNSSWDDTFIAKQYYVWVPKKKSKSEKLKPIENASIGQMYKAGPKKILVRDMTEDMIPQTLEYERHLNSRSSNTFVTENLSSLPKSSTTQGTKSGKSQETFPLNIVKPYEIRSSEKKMVSSLRKTAKRRNKKVSKILARKTPIQSLGAKELTIVSLPSEENHATLTDATESKMEIDKRQNKLSEKCDVTSKPSVKSERGSHEEDHLLEVDDKDVVQSSAESTLSVDEGNLSIDMKDHGVTNKETGKDLVSRICKAPIINHEVEHKTTKHALKMVVQNVVFEDENSTNAAAQKYCKDINSDAMTFPQHNMGARSLENNAVVHSLKVNTDTTENKPKVLPDKEIQINKGVNNSQENTKISYKQSDELSKNFEAVNILADLQRTVPDANFSHTVHQRRMPYLRSRTVSRSSWKGSNADEKICNQSPKPENKRAVLAVKKQSPSGPDSDLDNTELQIRDIMASDIVESEKIKPSEILELLNRIRHDKKKRAVMSPCSSRMRRTPFSQYSTSNRYMSAHSSKPLVVDSDGIDELLDLPRDVLMQVLDHTKQSDFTSREKLHEIIQKFYPIYDRMYTYESAASSDLLQQRKVQLHESKTRNIRQSHLMETKPVFYLDNDGAENEEEQAPPPVTQRFDSDYGSIRDLYMTGARDFPRFRKPLPAIGGFYVRSTTKVIYGRDMLRKKEKPDRTDSGYQKIPSISLGLPELPRGMRHTKTFTYNKRNYNKIDFSLVPVPTPPISSRESIDPQVVIGSDHGTTVNVNVPSPSSPRQQLVGVPMSLEERKALENANSATQSQRSTPLHAVSPAASTNVPQAPASTPAKQQSLVKTVPAPVEVPSGEMLARTNTGTSSPTQNIRAPVNSPRDASPDRERTGLGTIEEKHSEESNIQSRGRNVRFATGDVPEVPPPPSSPQEEEDTVAASELSTAPPTTKPGSTVATNMNTMNTRDPTLTETEMSHAVERKRESTMASTPEPWPSVNEADFAVTPASAQLALHNDSTLKNKKTQGIGDSRQAHVDPQSERGDSMQTGKSTMRSDDVSQGSSPSTKKQIEDGGKAESPGPPPPSPEPKDTNTNLQEESRTTRRINLKSRESATMEPLIEEHEENDTGQVKTIVVSVPPLGNQGKSRPKNYRTIDTFVSIDIPAMSPDSSSVAKEEGSGKMIKLEPHVEESSETDGLETRTLNTREQVLSQVSSVGAQTIDGHDSMSDVTSAGVTPSLGGNVSPTSTVTGGVKGSNVNLKLFIEEQDKGDADNSGNGTIMEEVEKGKQVEKGEEVEGGDEKCEVEKGEEVEKGDEKCEVEKGEEVEKGDEKCEVEKGEDDKKEVNELPEMTEEGGDHEGFKQDLKEEFERISAEVKDDQSES